VSPNTVKSYARALALWWQFLELYGLAWDAVTLENFGAFLTWLRTGDEPGVVSIERRGARFAESTISARLGAVLSCYDYHVLNGVDVGRDLHRITHRGGGRYKPLLEHVARRKRSSPGGDPGASPGPVGATDLDARADRADL
jgi:site-specific recombinase XerD